MTTKPTDSQKLELLYKKYLGYPDAYPGTLPSVEAPGSARQKVFSSLQILSQTVPSTAPSVLTVDNTFIGGSNIRYTNTTYPYIVKYDRLPLTSVKPNTSFTYSYSGLPNLLTNVIPTNFDALGSYVIYVYLNTIQISPDKWVLDVDAGYITFFDANVTDPVTISFWRYEGEVGLNNWVGDIIPPTKGGTGVNNGTKTITLGGNLTTSGAFTTTLTTTADTSVILPTTGTLAVQGATVATSQLSGQVSGANGGTGVNNGTKTITLGGNLTTSGAFTTTLTTTADTSVILPTTGILVSTSSALTQGSIPYADASGNLTQNNSQLYFSGSNLGIGTTTPSAKLHVSNLGSGSLTPAINVITSSNTPPLSLVMGDTRNYDSAGYEWDRGCHWIFNADGTNRYTGTGATLENLAGISMAYHNFGNYTADANQGATNIKFYTTAQNSGNTARELSEKMIIQYNGNVGIGTTSPQKQLDVNKSACIATPSPTSDSLFEVGSGINEYPPSALSSNATTISGQNYANGLYTVSTSSVTINDGWKSFDKITSTGWTSGFFYYGTDYIGTKTTTYNTNLTYSGEWIQIQLPVPVMILSFSLSAGNVPTFMPRDFIVLGSNNGTTWTSVFTKIGETFTAESTKSYSTDANTNEYTYYRLIVNKRNSVSIIDFQVEISEWRIYGYQNISTPAFKVLIENIGIAIASPAYRLHLGDNSAAKPSSTLWTVPSDYRIKENIIDADLNICYDNIKKIGLCRYKYRDDIFRKDQINDRSILGWIAQDVEKVFPKAITIKNMYGYEDLRCLDSDQIYASMYGATKKLIEHNETNINRITDLENKYNLLKTSNEEKDVKINELENKYNLLKTSNEEKDVKINELENNFVNIEMQYELLLSKLKVFLPEL